MKIIVNGVQCDEEDGQSLVDFLSARGYRRELVVTELNGAIVRAEAVTTSLLRDGDVLEIFHFMGGG